VVPVPPLIISVLLIVLINKHFNSITLISKSYKVPLTFDNFLFYFFSNIFLSACFCKNSKSAQSRQLSKVELKKSTFKLFYAPIKVSTLVSKQSKFFYNPVCSSFFNQSFSANITKLLSLFYCMGQENKKIAFFSLKNGLVNLSTILTHMSFNGPHAHFIFKVLYILTQKKVKTKRKKLKSVLRRLKAYSIFFLSLPKSKKFIKYVQATDLVTVGLTNSNAFDINVPIVNDWASHRLMYALQVYEYYRLGVEYKRLTVLRSTFFKLQNIYNLFFKV